MKPSHSLPRLLVLRSASSSLDRILLLALLMTLPPLSANETPDTNSGPKTAPPLTNSIEEYELKKLELGLSFITALGAAGAFLIGLRQYKKAEKWKRTEFLANEMKRFFDDPEVRNVLTMIDWAPRRINLFAILSTDSREYPLIDRKNQIAALRPHSLTRKDFSLSLDSQTTDTSSSPKVETAEKDNTHPKNHDGFTLEEARIRDSYDRFLDYLERFSSYITSGLITDEEFLTYFKYWIDDIAADPADAVEAAWTCALLGYIDFYGYHKVQQLFGLYGHDITPEGKIFMSQLALAPEIQLLGESIRETCRSRKK